MRRPWLCSVAGWRRRGQARRKRKSIEASSMKQTLLVGFAVLLCAPGAVLAQATETSQIKRGEYLVTIGSCHDCHTPLVMGPAGPEPDMKRALSGHPQDITVNAPLAVPEPW